jgi:monoterpene epsilon-lactone hydrolase
MPSAEITKLQRILRDKALPPGTPLAVRRAEMERLSFKVAEDIAVENQLLNGRSIEILRAPGTNSTHAILYLHGGGYVMGSPNTHRALAGEISRAAGATVFLPDYRLAPEAPFPAAVDDAVATFEWVIARGFKSANLAICGDSAGGGLTLATLLALRDRKLPLPCCAVPISPWSDLVCTNESYVTRAAMDPMVTPEQIREMAGYYLQGTDSRTPLASPNHADLRGLPPLLIHVGRDEILLNDSEVLHQRAQAAHVNSILEVWDDMIHVWHAFHPMLPEGKKGIARIGEYLRGQWGL